MLISREVSAGDILAVQFARGEGGHMHTKRAISSSALTAETLRCKIDSRHKGQRDGISAADVMYPANVLNGSARDSFRRGVNSALILIRQHCISPFSSPEQSQWRVITSGAFSEFINVFRFIWTNYSLTIHI